MSYAVAEHLKLAYELASLKMELVELKEKKTLLQARHDSICNALLPDAMAEMEIINVTIENIGRVSLYPMFSVKTLLREASHQWLRDEGDGDLIVPTVNASTLGAHLKQRKLADLPDPPEGIFDINAWSQARITKT